MTSEEHKPRHDHERSDWELKYVVWALVSFVISITVMLIGLWWIFKEFDRWAADRQMGAARVTEQENTPPEPLLQVAPQEDWTEMLNRERAILNSYRWIDRSKGIVHIPIERAMELAVGREVPAAEQGGDKTR
jgi:hypothetical protein